MKLATILQKFGLGVMVTTVFLLPLLFLPITSDYYEYNKNFLLMASSLILLVTWAVSCVVERQVRLVRSPLGLPVLVLVVVWLLSTVLRSPNRVEALLTPGQAGTWIALGIFYLTGLYFIQTKKHVAALVITLLSSVSLLGLTAVLWNSNLIVKLIPWNPIGPVLEVGTLLVSLIPMIIFLLVKHAFHRTIALLLSLTLLIVVGGAATSAYRIISPPNAEARLNLLPYSTSWGIALEALKTSPLLGTGPATYLSDFTRFRPVSFNLAADWALRFASSRSYYLEVLAVLGLAGLSAWLFLLGRTYQLFSKSFKLSRSSSSPHLPTMAAAAALSALACFAIQIFLPTNFLLLTILGILLVIVVASLKQLGTSFVHEANIDIVAAGSSGNSPLLPWIVLALSLAIAIPAGYLGGRAYAAEIYYNRALQAAGKNDGRTTYEQLIAAIRSNPYLDIYRSAYSRTNLLLANSLATNSQITDQDRTVITQLVQQGIREAKNAVALNPIKVTNLENLAVIYRNLLSFAEGADAWTIASYQQAILLDPVNPNLRIALGGVFFAQKNWDEAIRIFQQAVDLKPNLANAHYNLATAYREKGDLAKAAAAMQNVVQLVVRDTPDYQKATQELADLQQKIGVATPLASPSASQLTQPEPLPTPVVKPPLKLDQSLSPQAPATPSSNP